MTNPLPTECKDLAFARNLIAQMKGGGGRHNSTASEPRVAASAAAGVIEPQHAMAVPHRTTRRVQLAPYFNSPPPFESDSRFAFRWDGDCWAGPRNDPRPIPVDAGMSIIGRFRNGFIRNRFEYCEIEDVVHNETFVSAFRCSGPFSETVSISHPSLGMGVAFKFKQSRTVSSCGITDLFWERIS